MQVLKSKAGVFFGQCKRVFVIGGLPIELPLIEPDALSTTKIYCWN
jgi:hypothetical protein